MEHMIDTQFAAMLEDFSENVKYLRVDANVSASLGKNEEVGANDKLCELFKKASKNENLTVKLDSLKSESIPALLNVSEESRRMEEMMRIYSMRNGVEDLGAFPVEMTLIVNVDSPLIKKLDTLCDTDATKAEKIASYICKLSMLSQKKLSGNEMNEFLAESFDILSEL